MPSQPHADQKEDPVLSIVGLCLALDTLAADLYATIAAAAETNDLAVFWRDMAGV